MFLLSNLWYKSNNRRKFRATKYFRLPLKNVPLAGSFVVCPIAFVQTNSCEIRHFIVIVNAKTGALQISWSYFEFVKCKMCLCNKFYFILWPSNSKVLYCYEVLYWIVVIHIKSTFNNTIYDIFQLSGNLCFCKVKYFEQANNISLFRFAVVGVRCSKTLSKSRNTIIYFIYLV